MAGCVQIKAFINMDVMRVLKVITIDRRPPELLNVNQIIQVSTAHCVQIIARCAEGQITSYLKLETSSTRAIRMYDARNS
jgi:hypothetical protein